MKASKAFIFFLIAVLACTAVRYWQFAIPAVDFEKGFYQNNAGLPGSLLYIMFAAGFVGIIIFSLIDKKCKNNFFAKKMCKIDKTEAEIIAYMFLISGGALIFKLFSSIGEQVEATDIIGSLIGAAGFLAIGILLFVKKRIITLAGYLMFFPCVYFTVKAISIFTAHLVITRMSEYLVVLLFYIFMVFFYLGTGRVFIRAEGRFSRLRMAVCGYSAAALIVSETAAKLIYWLGSSNTMREFLTSGDSMFIMPDMNSVSEAITVIAIIIMMLKTPYKQDKKNTSVDAYD